MIAGTGMRDGWLWFDSDDKRLVMDKVETAIARYTAKHGFRPTICYLSQDDYIEIEQESLRLSTETLSDPTKAESLSCQGVTVMPAKNVMRYHFWLGVEECASS